MFGISAAELFVIILVGIIVIPARMWPDVARMLARAVKFVRRIIWRITDMSEQLKDKIDLEKPIDDLIHTTTNDILADFATPIKRTKSSQKKSPVKKLTHGGKKCRK